MLKRSRSFEAPAIRSTAFRFSIWQVRLRPAAVTLSVVGLAFVLTGCVKTRLPSASEYEQVKSGQRAIVLLRITSEIGGEPHQAFGHDHLPGFNFLLALGDFETGGQPSQVVPWYFSKKARKDGWTYFPLRPGTYYLAVYNLEFSIWGYNYSINSAALWKFDVRLDSKLVYIGTLHMPCTEKKSIIYDAVVIRNEESEASRLAAEYIPELGEPKTMLVERHEGPIILKSPEQ